MNDEIFMVNLSTGTMSPIETDLSRPSDGYEHLLTDIRESFKLAAKCDKPLFTTNVENLYDIFLANLPEEARQHYNCHECRRFVNTYGGLVTIDDEGYTHPVMWMLAGSAFFINAVEQVRSAVMNAKVTGVFLTKEKRLGVPKTGMWHHMAVDIPRGDCRFKHIDRLLSPGQKMAEKKEEYRMLMRACAAYKKETVETAVNLLRSNSLYRSEKILGIAEWFLDLKQHQGNRRFNNIAWKKVATAPAGFCHISSSMIGTLLDDIEDGLSFDTVARRFDEKMNPTKYQRPKAAPTAQNVARAEEIVAKLGVANSLKRRFARLSELQKLWVPAVDIPKTTSGVFSDIKTKEKLFAPKSITADGGVMTWEKFSRTVLPTAKKIEFCVPYHAAFYSALVTAVDYDAPPIIQWDSEENRNPFSWYLYANGSNAHWWGLRNGDWVTVNAIVLQPNMWQSGYEHQGKGVFFILDGCKDTKNYSSALFPEVLRGELHEVRATIEAYSHSHPLADVFKADACGLLLQDHGGRDSWRCELRVTTDLGVTTYRLDRWD